jgi:predicted RNA-binding Zn-ribbon protein involved in translation (DUF1610 family)
MTIVWEKQFWCDDCGRSHLIKLRSPIELSDSDKAAVFRSGEYSEQLRKHTVCASCGANIVPHNDLTIVSIEGKWKEICPACARNQGRGTR